jgi:ribonucleotide monophosphatase NagD (HAD superfamily)
MRGIKAILVDLSGTLHVENEPIPGAPEALQTLSDACFSRGIHVRLQHYRLLERQICFVTNTTKESRRLLLDRLRAIGFNLDMQRHRVPSNNIYHSWTQIMTSLTTASDYVKAQNIQNPMLLVDANALEEFHQDAGIAVQSGAPYDAVVVGLSPRDFHYERVLLLQIVVL